LLLPQGILWTSDCEAGYTGAVDTRFCKTEIASPPEGGLALILKMRSVAEAMECRLLVVFCEGYTIW